MFLSFSFSKAKMMFVMVGHPHPHSCGRCEIKPCRQGALADSDMIVVAERTSRLS
uniref:Uncharacterized protein n=1 Tax=Oryza sativa subsp. japonica TaxID=39947 RepID=Q69NC5_ORYSJ|nr:hypothetical protein [Oryza sativa Japonica Group]